MLGVLKKDGKKDEESKIAFRLSGFIFRCLKKIFDFRQWWSPFQKHRKIDGLARGLKL
jgi:hypothetical protein